MSVIDSYTVRPVVRRLGVQRLAMPAPGREPDEAAHEALVGEGPYAAGERSSLARTEPGLG
jgi:hypothetical protein